jgi:acetylornithine deacetylase/succinyl-diaminopimelate desuccinylase-like protein
VLFDLLEESKKLISLCSVSSEGTREIIEHLAPFCQKLGFHLTFQSPEEDNSSRQVNLIAHTVSKDSQNLCPHGLMMGTHLDTVPPGNPFLWTETGQDPFCATVKEGKIYGLGSADTKLDFLCKLQAIEKVGLKNIKVPLAL